MANGPPTPPLTTEIELQDEARGNLNIQPATGQLPATGEDVYQRTFPVIADLASQSNFQSLIQTAEHSDLNGDVNSDHRTTRLLITAPLVLAYLIIDHLPPARYALRRLPESLLSTPLCKSLVTLVMSISDRGHANVYSQAENLFNLVHQPEFFDQKLASVLTGLIASLVESFCQRTLSLLARAYTSLPLPLAQKYLGMQVDQLLSTAEKNQWSYDPSNNVLIPRNPNVAVSGIPKLSTERPLVVLPPLTFHWFHLASSSLSTFHFVADSVAKLEL